jgi:hypothetical protein
MYLSFAFWEWITCAVLSVYIGILSFAAQASGQRAKPQPESENSYGIQSRLNC